MAESLSRHWMFALPTFAIIVFTLLVGKLMPGDEPSGSHGSGIDWPGLLLLSGTLATLILVLVLAPQAGSAPVVFGALVVVLVAFAAGWVAVERRAVAPMIDLRMLARPMVWKSCVVTFVICLGTANGAYLVPQLLDVSGDGYGFGASPTTIGLVLLPGAVAATLAGPIGGIGERRFGPRTMTIISTVMMAFALLGLSAVHGEIWHIVVGKALIALANGLCVTAMMTGVASYVDEGDTGIATSVLLVTRALGSAVGAMLGGALLTANTVMRLRRTGRVRLRHRLRHRRHNRGAVPARRPYHARRSQGMTLTDQPNHGRVTPARTVLVSGASIAGPTVAYWLNRYGYEVTVVERAPAPRSGGYPIDIRGTALGVVERMGLLPRLREAHIEMERMTFYEGEGDVVATLRPQSVTGGVAGRDLEVRRGDLTDALYGSVRDDVEFLFNDSIVSLDQSGHGVDVTFKGAAAAPSTW